jgi:hypothetical protein
MKVLLYPFKALGAFLKMSGVKGALLFGLGLALGLLFAPRTGAELRAKLAARAAAMRGDSDLVDGDLMV